MDLNMASTIKLCLADDVMYNVTDEETSTGLWSRLETLYMTKSLSNKLYLKKKLYGATHERWDNGVGAFILLQQDHQRASSC